MPILSRIEGPQDLRGLSHEQLAELAQECRDVIIQTITKTGGHLASNLGVVELTLALHRAFDSPKDKLVWDTSNQCYTHKLVTGRRDQFPTIRTPGDSPVSPSRQRASTTPSPPDTPGRGSPTASACPSRARPSRTTPTSS